jgi:prepilin-type N-terminal cleavage/methylation domain-containing protein
MNHKNKGFSIVEIILVIAVIAIVGFVGWKAWDTFSNNKTADTTQTQQINTDQAPAVNDNAGLDKSAATLDAINVEGTESTQLKSQTNF